MMADYKAAVQAVLEVQLQGLASPPEGIPPVSAITAGSVLPDLEANIAKFFSKR